jgi:molybdenum transport protein
MNRVSSGAPERSVAAAAGAAERALDDTQLLALLREDAPFGDLTSDTLLPRGQAGRMRFEARGPMCVAATEEALRLVQLAGARAELLAHSGSRAVAGQVLLQAEGPAHALLLAWKVAQTLVEATSGIATATAAIVDALRTEGFATPLACTRKNFPGTRAIAAKAVRAGGGTMHRLGLSETLLVFAEHRAFIAPDRLTASLAALRATQPEKRLVAEVGDADEAIALAGAGVELLQLERFTPAALRALRERLQTLGLAPKLAPAGGVTRVNALDYARAGADLLISSAPYFAPPADVKVRIESAT